MALSPTFAFADRQMRGHDRASRTRFIRRVNARYFFVGQTLAGIAFAASRMLSEW